MEQYTGLLTHYIYSVRPVNRYGTVHSPMDHITVPTNVTPSIELLSTTSLKKKDVETKTSKHKRNWLDKKHKSTKKGGNKKEKVQRCVTRKKKKVKGV
jgi:hypothetical protein